MKREAYDLQTESADRHWWWEGRRGVLDAALGRMQLPTDSRILEIGCGTGSTFPVLARHGKVWGSDPDETMVALAAGRAGVQEVRLGFLPDRLPFGEETFDLIAMLDVLEHVDEETAALKAAAARLAPGGRLLITVPAYQFLWSKLDELAGHKRRYTRRRLLRACRDAGLAVDFATYMNCLLLLPAAVVRLVAGDAPRGLTVPGDIVNALCTAVFTSELGTSSAECHCPFGLSVLAVCRTAQR